MGALFRDGEGLRRAADAGVECREGDPVSENVGWPMSCGDVGNWEINRVFVRRRPSCRLACCCSCSISRRRCGKEQENASVEWEVVEACCCLLMVKVEGQRNMDPLAVA